MTDRCRCGRRLVVHGGQCCKGGSAGTVRQGGLLQRGEVTGTLHPNTLIKSFDAFEQIINRRTISQMIYICLINIQYLYAPPYLTWLLCKFHIASHPLVTLNEDHDHSKPHQTVESNTVTVTRNPSFKNSKSSWMPTLRFLSLPPPPNTPLFFNKITLTWSSPLHINQVKQGNISFYGQTCCNVSMLDFI